VTCVVEADGILNDRTKDYYAKVWNGLRQANIPFTFHWGKLNDLNSDHVQHMYGPNVGIWKAARDRLLSNPDVKALFINDTLRAWGLD
jgi:hypothetical protein